MVDSKSRVQSNEPELSSKSELHVPVVDDQSSVTLLRSKELDGTKKKGEVSERSVVEGMKQGEQELTSGVTSSASLRSFRSRTQSAEQSKWTRPCLWKLLL